MSSPQKSVAILGIGSFGIALSRLFVNAGVDVVLWGRDSELVARMRANRTVQRPIEHTLDPQIEITTDLGAALEQHWIVLCVSSSGFRSVCQNILATGVDLTEKFFLSASKGVEIETFTTMSHILRHELDIGEHQIGVISGPNLADEILQDQFSATVIASTSQATRQELRNTLASNTLRVYDSDQVEGVELGGVLKNVYAIAMGLADALGVGWNTKGMLITRALAEEERLLTHLLGTAKSLISLANVGDLITTAFSSSSRNYSLGFAVGGGKDVQQLLSTGTFEGYYTVAALRALSEQHDLDLPLADAVYDVLHAKKPLDEAVSRLMEREPKAEDPF